MSKSAVMVFSKKSVEDGRKWGGGGRGDGSPGFHAASAGSGVL